jgi:hypothetical protein
MRRPRFLIVTLRPCNSRPCGAPVRRNYNKAGPKAKGGRPSENLSDETTGFTSPTLPKLGVTRDQSSEWQKLARVPNAEFEDVIAEQEITRASVLPAA